MRVIGGQLETHHRGPGRRPWCPGGVVGKGEGSGCHGTFRRWSKQDLQVTWIWGMRRRKRIKDDPESSDSSHRLLRGRRQRGTGFRGRAIIWF